MLRLRPEHLAPFDVETECALHDRIVDHLIAEHEECVAGLSDDLLLEMVGQGVIRARAYGFENESDLAAFVAIMFEIAPNFDENPRLKWFLTMSAVKVEDRLVALAQNARPEDWDQAEADYDEDAWFASLEGATEADDMDEEQTP